MKVLITGARGQLGFELQRTAPAGHELLAYDTDELDITRASAVQQIISTRQLDLIINAAAYTAVDKAEQEMDLAYAVNRDGASNLAQAASDNHIRLIHVSTDFIFDGNQARPYLPQDKAHPLGVYGASKWSGEQRVRDICPDHAVILRTAWVYSKHGNNFVKTMLRLMAERTQLKVVADQVGTPTWAKGLAYAIWKIAENRDMKGVWHWTDAGVASWYDFAVAIQEEAVTLGLLEKQIEILPIRSEEYPTPAKRPHYSVLEKSATWQCLGMAPVHWRASLRQMLKELKDNRHA
ncbi:MAG: dTDP-4-dehydrorhamnose reductase [Gammaproteobacteria bacterium RBG_16_57_12]|nr:MAG: dTDP-4-dehydrorhamnose reductase [Gammaproteobacteria bacterium RBG_16_57_12]